MTVTANIGHLQNYQNLDDVESLANADLKADDNNVVFADILFVLATYDVRTFFEIGSFLLCTTVFVSSHPDLQGTLSVSVI